ncbi:hypothetical protein [Amycolatopsis sp. NPDC004079]|uniref:hypothetical protein n=1 Tax=Amycolatopsis sp. NPDC004079 TaxID=3154549 RepID=UPI0033BE8A25
MNVKEVEAALEAYREDAWGFWGRDLGLQRQWSRDPKLGVIDGLGRVELMDLQLGQGDNGEGCWMLLRAGGRYFRKDGTYDPAYDIATWEGQFREVWPTPKIVYE